MHQWCPGRKLVVHSHMHTQADSAEVQCLLLPHVVHET
jgi:hypothetical protein